MFEQELLKFQLKAQSLQYVMTLHFAVIFTDNFWDIKSNMINRNVIKNLN